jgi:hypothetical protein
MKNEKSKFKNLFKKRKTTNFTNNTNAFFVSELANATIDTLSKQTNALTDQLTNRLTTLCSLCLKN